MNMSVEDKQGIEEDEHLKKLKMLTDKYGERGFGAYVTFPNDVESGNPLRNREIANILKLTGFYNPAILVPNIRFL
jgi:hypothetical protein